MKTVSDLLEHERPAESTALAPVADVFTSMVERLATNPAVDVTKLEKLIEMQERILAHNAETAFNVAFAAMQPKIPTIKERARTDKTSYAPLEDIVEAVRPILAQHGFSLSFRTAWPDKGSVKVVGMLTHEAGHCRESEFLSAADTTGSKNAIQALGSAVSYGKRYTTKDLLCIVTREEDDDGYRSGTADQPDPPAGYEDWCMDMAATADTGTVALEAAWKASKPQFRAYITKYYPKAWVGLKDKAAKVRA